MKRFNRSPLAIAAVPLTLFLLTGGMAAAEIDLASLDLEDLVSMEVTSVSKKAERAFEAPAAAFVITSEDIRRSGSRTVPELLRMVPGVQVAQLASNQYAITVRGFNGNFSDKLLVLIDGRSVYTPLFAGVFWDIQDLPLADVDRIEVIRGPGGTVWGANAVNGVINIVTKTAGETQGWHVETGVSNYERAGSGSVRYGGSLGDTVDFRVYLKHFDREKYKDADADAHDAWDQIRTGFRMDAKIGDSGDFTLQGDLYDGEVDGTVSGDQGTSTVGGGNVLARYTHSFSDSHNASIQFYYDRTDRNSTIVLYELDTFDVELKHQIAPVPWLDLVWGGEYRHRRDDSKTRNPAGFDPLVMAPLGLPEAVTIDPSSRKIDLFSGFAQAEARFLDDMIRITVGTKLEDNGTSGFEYQPSGRVAFVPDETLTLWATVSRAVRTPSRADEDIDSVGVTSTGVPNQSLGSRDAEAEDLMAYEAGFRIQPTEYLHFDVAGFYNDYDDLMRSNASSRIVVLPGPTFVPVVESLKTNSSKGVAWGIELFSRLQVPVELPLVKKWSIDGTYAYLDVDVERDSGVGLDELSGGALGRDDAEDIGRTEAHHTVGMRSHLNFDCNLELDLSYYFVSKVSDVGGDEVDSYHRFDIRTAWRPTEQVEASFGIDNVFDGAHKEWNTEQFVAGTKIPRIFYGKITLDF